MQILGKKEPLILLAGDLFFLIVSLWISLFLRNLSVPAGETFYLHLVPFTILFFVWIIVFYIAGLYGKHTVILKSKLPSILLNVLLANSVIAIIFFYFIPFFGITPKTVLFIYLAVSFVAVLLWRMYGYSFIGSRRAENAIIIGSGSEMRELHEEVNRNDIYNIRFVSSIDLDRVEKDGFWDEIVGRIYAEGVSVIVIDLEHSRVEPILPHLYNLIFSSVSFVDLHRVYEDIFDRVPLSLLKYNWFLENISTHRNTAYDALKRLMDIFLGIGLLILSIPFDIAAYIAIKIEDGGPAFITQSRIGQNNKLVKIVKFRTMTGNDEGNYKNGGTELYVTRIGRFLRRSRIDEFPQFWNVIRGDLSLVGPRPELPSLMKLYEKEIPYYNVRHIIKPGLSGWAQIYHENHPHHGQAVAATREKLSYDLYYIKNRSLLLDLQIALRTIKTLLSRAGL
ncbi:exopolysaccharide biosynthesis polyprenyl glycosylphosphotransferase [Candidatus Parcubacteria bacterium]|nr:exopolysaccharide biosynthesis polyprenyl glycosylphosphotransferase [Candidatus Parcubacteria bacterium]